VNRESLGWEIANRNDDREPYSLAQYRTIGELLAWYLPQGLSADAVTSHEAVALPSGRKTDPRGWDWEAMWRTTDGLAHPGA
jgi:N-acetyl-anhydromuramyl-L-alanine amidase AmpD